MTPAVLPVRGIEPHWEPDLRLRVVDVEPRRHDPEHGRLSAVEIDLLANESRVAAQGTLPELIGHDTYGLAVWQVFPLREDAPAVWANTE